jgi:hypothetical protein
MPPPYVTSAKFAGGQMIFNVIVDGFDPGDYVEISGAATQVGGAFAAIHKVVPVPNKPTDPGAEASVDVTANPCSDKKFRKDLDVTVYIRIAKIWVTVLGEGRPPPDKTGQTVPEDQGTPVDEGTMWGHVRQVAQMYAPKSSSGSSQG